MSWTEEEALRKYYGEASPQVKEALEKIYPEIKEIVERGSA